MTPRPANVGGIRAVMAPGEAVIATYVGQDKTYVWAVSKTGPVAFAAAPLGRKRIGSSVAALRRALDPQATTLGDIPEFDVVLSYRLYRDLLAPVKAGWQDAKSLLVVAHGALGQLPF